MAGVAVTCARGHQQQHLQSLMGLLRTPSISMERKHKGDIQLAADRLAECLP